MLSVNKRSHTKEKKKSHAGKKLQLAENVHRCNRVVQTVSLSTMLEDCEVCKVSIWAAESESARLNAVKEQIWICYLGLGWEDVHHPWYKSGVTFSSNNY